MKFPISIDSPEDKLAHAIAQELLIEGVFTPRLAMMALSIAIRLMAVIDEGHEDPLKAIQKLAESRKYDDEWWVKYHPKTKMGRAAKRRLEGR